MSHKPMLIAIGDAARLLKVSRSTIHRMCVKRACCLRRNQRRSSTDQDGDAMAAAQQLRGAIATK